MKKVRDVLTKPKQQPEPQTLKLVKMGQPLHTSHVVATFNRPLTDDELRFFHKVMEKTIRFLMDPSSEPKE